VRRAEAAFLLVVPPALVVFTLLAMGNVWATFLSYHLGACVVAPLLFETLRGASLRDHAARVGLTGGRTRAGIRDGLILGAILAAGQVAALGLGGDLFFANEKVVATLASWGAGPEQAGPLLLVMLALNGPAEELYWRGYAHTRLGGGRAATVGTALAYASYHGVTLYALFGSPEIALLILVAVFGAGLFWSMLRERYGNVSPAALSHGGATLGYMFVYWDRFVRA